jgi:hypothetical protein
MQVVEKRGPQEGVMLDTHMVLEYRVKVEEVELGGQECPVMKVKIPKSTVSSSPLLCSLPGGT